MTSAQTVSTLCMNSQQFLYFISRFLSFNNSMIFKLSNISIPKLSHANPPPSCLEVPTQLPYLIYPSTPCTSSTFPHYPTTTPRNVRSYFPSITGSTPRPHRISTLTARLRRVSRYASHYWELECFPTLCMLFCAMRSMGRDRPANRQPSWDGPKTWWCASSGRISQRFISRMFYFLFKCNGAERRRELHYFEGF